MKTELYFFNSKLHFFWSKLHFFGFNYKINVIDFRKVGDMGIHISEKKPKLQNYIFFGMSRKEKKYIFLVKLKKL